ncbi:MAG: hypothetical protein WB799_05445, partial [Candidatus Sulfotelmatobacter sp.]
TLGGASSKAQAINVFGQIVGWSSTKEENKHAFSWTESGGMQDLGVLKDRSESQAVGINASGQVVGSCTGSANSIAFLRKEGSGLVELEGQGDTFDSEATAMNAFGQVVGTALGREEQRMNAFVWTKSSGMRSLGDLIPEGSGWILNVATAINNLGQIAGYGPVNGVTHAFLLTPISSQQTY